MNTHPSVLVCTTGLNQAGDLASGDLASGDLASDDLASNDIDEVAAASLRLLSADAVQAANSGHPGLPMGCATAAWVLWSRFLKHDPAWPGWPDRDRFILSAGHGSALLYSLLHVFGYGLELEELRRFRQAGSKTPGHPEFGHPIGVETTTGPLGQGLATGVGMALAERMMAERVNTDDHTIVDHRCWVLAGDGDLMEGISHEAASLAGHLHLGRLNVIYDDNDITIDGPASQSCTDDVSLRFRSYGWQVVQVVDGNDPEELAAAYQLAWAELEKPTLIVVRTVIGYGSPAVAGTSSAHGSPLGAAELELVHSRFGQAGQRFHVPDRVHERIREFADQAFARSDRWRSEWTDWAQANPVPAATWRLGDRAPMPSPVTEYPSFEAESTIATRAASGVVLNRIGPEFLPLVGGSADLAGSTNTTIEGTRAVAPGHFGGRTIHFGIREHAMGAMLNGIALHGGLRAYGSTFLVFSDYMRPAIRLAALMKLPVVYVFTHDSIAVGEDGPTHQPVEHIESLRVIPGLRVLRPADASETSDCWRLALQHQDGPTALILSRQALPVLARSEFDVLSNNGYQLVQGDPQARAVLAASGSEVELALAAAQILNDLGVRVEVWSVPWRERLATAISEGTVTLPESPIVWIEAGVTTGWRGLARDRDAVLGIDRFGASAPGPAVAAEVGLTAQAAVELTFSVLNRSIIRVSEGN